MTQFDQEAMDELFMRFHDISMDGDPDMALRGRLLKALYPSFCDCIESERIRGSDYVDIIQYVAMIYATFVTSSAIQSARPGLERNATAAVSDTFRTGCDHAYSQWKRESGGRDTTRQQGRKKR